MQSLKQYFWLALLMAAGCVAAWFFTPPGGRNLPGLLLACAAIVAILVASGWRRTVRSDRYRERYGERYFARCLRYDLVNGDILITDNRSPRVITLDPSLVLIFGAADGQRTAQQFISELQAAFPPPAPPSVARQTYQLMAKMEEESLIRFADQKTQLPYYLSMPISQQDKEKALVEMRKDGFIK
jgi:hypothetical protein